MQVENRVHPELKTFFSAMEDLHLTKENIVQLRGAMNEMLSGDEVKMENVKISERFIASPNGAPDVRIRIYEPVETYGAVPAILYIHGGGFIIGSIEMFDASCQMLVAQLDCVVVSVGYRLAPEHPYPAGVEDCYTALEWLAANASELGIDLTRLAVHGASAGGGLTAAVSLLARDRKGPKIAFQMPLYPMIDNRCILPSNDEITDARVWNGPQNQRAWEMYLGPHYASEAPIYAAPLHADDYANLPPTYTFIGDLDPFRDETIEYVARLTKAGVPTEFHLYPGCFHGFEHMVPQVEISQRAIANYMYAFKKAFEKAASPTT